MAEIDGGPRSSLEYMESILGCSEIPVLVKMYRPLLVRCLIVTDIVPYLGGVISTREKETVMRQYERRGSTVAMEELLFFIEGSSHNEKWTKLVDIIEKKGYKYVAKALRGQRVKSDAYKKFTKILQQHKMDLVQNIDPSQIWVKLESLFIIEVTDREEIEAEMRNKGPMSAMLVLLDRIWRRDDNWYHVFLEALCEKGYKYIVEEIDDEFAEEWKDRIRNGNCIEHGIPHPSESRLSKPVQCESDIHAPYPGPTIPGTANADPMYPGPSFLDPSIGQSQTSCKYIAINDHGEENDETGQKKISEVSDLEVQFESSFNFDEILSSGISEESLSKEKDTTNANKSNPRDNYDHEETRTNVKVLYTRNGNQEIDNESVTEKKVTEHDTSQPLAENNVSIKILKLRQYQLEQAEQSLMGENCLIVSPTGSGKTYVAIRIIQSHLDETGKVKKVVFIVDKNNLANQQSEKIKDYVRCRLKVISGDTQREEDFQEMKPLLPQYDVFVVTAQMLVNALTNQGVSIRDFSLLIFDECHHCHGSHPFKQIMNQYMDVKLEQTDEESQLPQVVGFTASVGVGKAKTIEKATEYLKQVMSNMDAHYLVTVQKNRRDLAKHVNSPEQFIKEVPVRPKDEFGVRVKSLMVTTEKYLEDTGVGIVDRNAIQPPSLKGNEQYTQWLEDVLLKALAKLSKSEATRSLFTIRKYLEIYNNALVHHSYARASDALNCIKTDIDNLPKLSRNENKIERKIKSLFEGEYTILTECALDHERTAENPLMLKLKEIIITTHEEEPNMRGIVFVRTRILADILASWMDSSKELQHIKARKYTGSQAQTVEGGMTKHEQVNAIELFKNGEFKIIVATTIAEEGLDIKECNLVVRYDYAGNPISLVQARGRGRAENSRFYVLASAEKCVAEREWVNTLKEPMMKEAMKKVQQEIDSNHDVFLEKQQEFQKLAKRERDAAKHNKGRRVVGIGQYNLRCLKCNAFLCMSSELRKILNAHHTCISEDIKNNIIGKKYSKAAFQGEDIEMGVGQISCKECLVKLGTIALFKDVFFPILSITALKIEDDLERGDTLKKWKFVERYFKVPELTEADLENVAKFERLIEF
ncbi:antiviral innate immune response receptor RIG-I-like isoform X1 [Saccostrea echinata]|uniref:antiviral innate immune response receptor RIG-I-like isoform X1 n=1 Tax=Saccostrea echinata TaxID=191078 RepID=UPI002A81A073|nr:antiviral innate immune response receptor RIG-I-like isoform X1 [Saccostrea echinata]